MGASSQSVVPSKSNRCICCQCCIICFCLVAVVVGAAVGFAYLFDSDKTPIYYATITAVSGFDPETGLRQPAGALSPVFNLTVGVASHARWQGARIGPGTSVKVSYSQQLLPMATGLVPAVSVGPRASRDLRVVASGRDVAVPGFLMDSLAEEMRTGQAMFQVKLIELRQYGWSDRVDGWGRVGDTIRLT